MKAWQKAASVSTLESLGSVQGLGLLEIVARLGGVFNLGAKRAAWEVCEVNANPSLR